jgi:hypothetical protein
MDANEKWYSVKEFAVVLSELGCGRPLDTKRSGEGALRFPYNSTGDHARMCRTGSAKASGNDSSVSG